MFNRCSLICSEVCGQYRAQLGRVHKAIGAGSLQVPELITLQLSHLPTSKQSVRGSREARGRRTQAAKTPRSSGSSLWLAWPILRPQSWAQQSLARPRSVSGLGTRGAARCAVSSHHIATHVATGAALFGTYARAFRHVDVQPWSRPGRAIAVELRGSLGAPKEPRHVSQVSFLGCRSLAPHLAFV